MVKEPSVSGLKSRTARPNSKVQLKCKAKGNPVPDITWFKDDHPVTRTENIIINQTKTISKLTIKKMSTSDVGTYECRATSAFGPPASSKASLRLGAGSKIRPTLKPSSTMGPDKSRPCGGYDEYCLNGGKCFFYETLGEYVCQCAEGYKGRRCESKGVYHHGSMDWTYHINILTVVVILAGFLFCLTIGGIVAYFIHRKKKQWETNEPESRRRSRKRISKISVGSVEVIEMKELSESFLQPASEDKIFNTSARCEVSAQFHGQAATAAPDRVKQLDSNENLMNSSGFHRNMPEQRTVPSRSASQNNQRPGRHSHTSLQETAHFPDIVASGNSLNKSRPAKP